MKEKYFILYHKVDMDGVCSAALVYNYLLDELNVDIDSIKLVPWNYGFNLPKTSKNDVVYVVDLGMKLCDLITIKNNSKRLIWIDHHDSAIDEYNDNKSELSQYIEGLRSKDTLSACGLVYKYLYSTDTLPRFVELLSDYDVWNNQCEEYWEQSVMPFQLYMKTYYLTSDSNCVIKLARDIRDLTYYFNYDVDRLIDMGVSMYDYQKNLSANYNNYIHIGKLDGFNVAHINSLQRNSLQFYGSNVTSDVDILCVYTHNNGIWEYSIYNDNGDTRVNCGEIAKKYGGGGHMNAAGFQLDYFIF